MQGTKKKTFKAQLLSSQKQEKRTGGYEKGKIGNSKQFLKYKNVIAEIKHVIEGLEGRVETFLQKDCKIEYNNGTMPSKF